MERSVEISTFEHDVILVDKKGKNLPAPMITVAVDCVTRVIIGIYISTGKPRKSNSIAEL